MARCLICGRRYPSETPSCGHDQPPAERDSGQPSHDLDLAVLRVPGYRLDNMLGSGGFGVVAAATREADGTAVAIKISYRANSEANERLRLEADALRRIGPPHVPELYEVGSLKDGSPYFACERLYLPSLDIMLAESREPITPGVFAAMADAIMVALGAAHAHGLVHLDLKPENIFIGGSPVQARIIDFGIVKDLFGEPTRAAETGIALGTTDYMSPEQCSGAHKIDRRSDIYSLGVVMYELLTGQPPFFGATAEVRAAHVGRRPTRPSQVADVTSVFDAIILTCLAKEPARRFHDVASVRRALALAATHDSESAAPTQPRLAERPSKRQQLRRMGLLFFEAMAPTGDIKHAITALGGALASVEGKRCIAVFGLDTSDNPVQRALGSAQSLIARGMCERIIVDQDRLRVRSRPDGTVRVFAAALSHVERYPRTSDPRGVLLTSAAAEMLPDIRTSLVRDGVLREYSALIDANTDTEATMMQIGSREFIGRASEIETMLESARVAFMDKKPTIVTVLSESGYGKSHLCTTVASRVKHTMPMTRIIQFRAREPIGGENNRTLRAFLRTTMGLPRALPASQGRELLRERLDSNISDEVWSAVALTMGWLSADAPEVRRFSAAPSALRAAATRAAGEALRKLARKSAICCVLDDAHFADETTLDALEYATLSEARSPIWICAAAQPSFTSARPSWGRRAGRSDRIELGPLADEDAADLCRHLLIPAENVSHETVKRMVEQTHSSPFLLTELVHAIKRQGLIRQRGRGNAHFLATDELAELTTLPQVEWLAARELAALPSELAAHARLIALLSQEVTPWEVEGVLGALEAMGMGAMFPLDAKVGLNRLQLHGVLLAHREGTYSFRHQLIRNYVAQSTPEDVRVEIHRAAYQFYRDASTLHDHRRLPQLASHAAACGLTEQAAALYLELAAQASYRHNYMDAELMYTRALAMLPETEDRARMSAYNGRGLMRYRLSRFEDALDDLNRARALARERGDRQAEITIILDEATVLDWMMDYRKSKELIEQARALAPHIESLLIDARLCLGEARSHVRLNRTIEAMESLDQAARKAEPLGDPGYETRVIALMMFGTMATLEDRQELAQTAYERVIALCEERGDRLHLASAYANRTWLWLKRRDVERAVQDCLHCRRIGREIGLSELEYLSSYNAAEIFFMAGDDQAALPYLQRAVEMEPSNSKRPLSLLLRARIAVYSGQIKQATRVLDKISRAQDESRAVNDMDALFTEVEEVLYDMARLAIRDDASEADWDALHARAMRILPVLELAEFIEIAGLTARRRGQEARARRLLQAALDTCLENSLIIEERVRRELTTLE